MLGYAPNSKGYKVMNLKIGKVSVRYVVHFDEPKRADKRGTMLDTSEVQDYYVGLLLGITVSMPSQHESNRE